MKDLFGEKPRRKRRVMMHVSDAGNGFGDTKIIKFKCQSCDYETDWLLDESSVSENRAGDPCPNCNDKD